MAELKDDETRLAKFGKLSADRKAAIRAEQQKELEAATKERSRPLGLRALDTMEEMFGHPKNIKAARENAAADTARREQRFQEAKRTAEMSDEELDAQPRYYGDTQVHKFSKGGKVKTASARADGIAKRGKTRGKVV